MNPPNPAVSVLLLSFNRSQYIGQAIESVLNQTFGDFELLIFDNSTDMKPYEIAKQYAEKDSRIRLFREEKRLDISAAHAWIVKKARAEYIATMEDDDWWAPEKLQKQHTFMEQNKHVGVYCCSLYLVDENGDITGERLLRNSIMPPTMKLGDVSHFGIYYLGSGQLYRKDVYIEVNQGREYINIGEDIDNFYRLQEKYHYASTSECLIYYRFWGNNTSKNIVYKMFVHAAYISAIFRRKNLPDPVESGISVEEFLADLFHTEPFQDNHLHRERQIAKYFLRSRRYYMLNRFLHNRPCTLEGKYKLYLKLIGWSFLHFRLGYFFYLLRQQ